MIFEQAQVSLQEEDFILNGVFSFTQEQLFTFTLSSPETLRGAVFNLSPTGGKFSFASLSTEEIPENSPILTFYHVLCAAMDRQSFTKTETGFIRDIGGETVSILSQGNSLVLLSENIQASITPSQN